MTADTLSVPFADLQQMHAEVRPELDAMWARSLATGQFVGGPPVEAFETQWAEYIGARYAVGVANGTDALMLALVALGIGSGDEVLVPANTFVATAEAVSMAGATPVFVDVDPVTLLVTPETLAPALTGATAAVVPVHLFGHVADMDRIVDFCARHGLALVEDAAQAHGARWGDRVAGTFGAVGCFSFYPGKNLGALGDGGAIVTDDPVIAEAVRSLANHGRDGVDRYVHPRRGVNSRLDTVQAGSLSVKLGHLARWGEMRAAVVDLYRERLGTFAGDLVDQPPGCTSAWHLLVLRTSERAELQRRMASAGVETGVHYPVPCHLQQAYRTDRVDVLPVAERAAHEIISLPLFPHMTARQVDRVVETLLRAELAS